MRKFTHSICLIFIAICFIFSILDSSNLFEAEIITLVNLLSVFLIILYIRIYYYAILAFGIFTAKDNHLCASYGSLNKDISCKTSYKKLGVLVHMEATQGT